jgi:hypothetical protein
MHRILQRQVPKRRRTSALKHLIDAPPLTQFGESERHDARPDAQDRPPCALSTELSGWVPPPGQRVLP